MPRVDVWDIPEDRPTQPIWIGYKQGLTDKYELGKKLGEGGFGSVRVVVQKSNGAEFACKSICKRLDVPNLPPIKQQQHLENIKREVLILRKLRGTLNVVHLACAYEDETHVHIVMEYCRGGELFHKMGRRHYSERTVASYMRAVLRTLAQCHAQRILHRDIKPGNFMLLTEAEDSPLKAIDFGLAVFFDPAKLPRTDLGLEGTPWYMAPEVLSSCVEPASDVWAAGVMAYQLLSGRFPFDDWAHPEAPALSLVWRSILSEAPSFKGSSWGAVSEPAKDFCRTLLNKDPSSRPSAREALAHPWLQKGNTQQRLQGTQLTQVVQRLQRHSQQDVFKKTVLDMMANELLARHMARAQQQQQQEQPPSSPPPPPQAQLPHALPGVTPGPAAAPAAGGGLRQLPGVIPGLGGACSLTPQYAEGSVNRRQQLLRLVPPKRSPSLELGSQEAAALGAAATAGGQQGVPGASAAGGVVGSPASPGVASRLEGTWHGPVGVGASAATVSSPGALEGSFRRGVGSMRGATSALEALRRARERAAAAEADAATGGVGAPAPGAAGDSGGLGVALAAAAGGVGAVQSPGAAAGALRGEVKPEEGGSARYKGPVKDPSTASLWDLQFMANRLAMEGSAHGNAYTQRLLKAASTHAGKTPAAAAMLQAAAALQQQQQQQQRSPQLGGCAGPGPLQQQRLSGEAVASPPAPSLSGQLPPSPQQQPPRPQPPHQQQQAASVVPPQAAAAVASQRLEGTWHGPSRSSSINVATVARECVHEGRAELDRDLSWHGRTSHMRQLSEQEARAGSKAAGEHREFLAFLEAAKRARQEQRKVARLVLEGSTHGGVQYFLPARGTSSIAVAYGAKAAAGPAPSGPGSFVEGEDDVLTDGEDEADGPGAGGASIASRSSIPGTPGSSGHGSTAPEALRDGSVVVPAPQKAPSGLLGKLRRSLKKIVTPADAAKGDPSDLNALARSSWRPGLAAQDPVLGAYSAGHSPSAAAAVAAAAAQTPRDSSPHSRPHSGHTTPLGTVLQQPAAAAGSHNGSFSIPAAAGGAAAVGGSDSGGGGGSGKAHLAEQILGLQSPGWQASLETRRRGQGAYAALMAATSMATEAGAGEAAGAPAGGEQAPQAAAAAVKQPGDDAATQLPTVGLIPQQQQQQQQPAACTAASVRPQAAPQHVGLVQSPAPGPATCLTPLEQALQVQTQQQVKQQQDAYSNMLVPPVGSQQLQQLQDPGPQGGQQRLLPVPGQAAQQLLPQLQQQAAPSWQPPAQDSMLPVPKSTQQQQGQPHGGVGTDLLPKPGGTREGPVQQRDASALVPQPATACAAAPGSTSTSSSMLPGPGSHKAAPPAVQQQQQQQQPVAGASRAAVGHHGYTPFWAVGGAGAAAGGDHSALPMPSSQAGPQQAAAAGHGSASAAPEHKPAAATQPSSHTAAPASAAGGSSSPGVSAVAPAPAAAGGVVVPALAEVSRLLDLLAGSSPELVTVEQLQQGLAGLGYLLEPSEVLELACNLGYGVEGAQGVPLSQLAASQLDWEELQVNHREEWLQCLRATFDAMDVDKDGRLRPSEILEALRDKLPEAEVNAAIEDVLLEAAADEDEGLDFAAFKMLASLAADGPAPLDQYDARLPGSQDAGGSVRSQGLALQQLLHTVPEAEQ